MQYSTARACECKRLSKEAITARSRMRGKRKLKNANKYHGSD